MTAEEKLKELYQQQDGVAGDCWANETMKATNIICHNAGIYVAAEHIDLIADLVVQRLIQLLPPTQNDRKK